MSNGCDGLDLAEFNHVDWTVFLRRTLACGVFKVTGHASVDGQRAIEVTGAVSEHHSIWPGMRVAATIDFSPTTYFPLRVIWRNWMPTSRPGWIQRGTVRQDFQLLPPTPRDIALAKVTVPAGFRHVRGAPFGTWIFPLVGPTPVRSG
jgi:hypothetical protein